MSNFGRHHDSEIRCSLENNSILHSSSSSSSSNFFSWVGILHKYSSSVIVIWATSKLPCFPVQ